MTDIDSIVDKSLAKSMEEPKHVLVHRWFKTWKMFKYETASQHTAYDKFNTAMEQLSQRSNAVVDAKRSKVMLKDISPASSPYAELKYIVEVYWRDKEPRDGQ